MNEILLHRIWMASSVTVNGERPLEHPVSYEPCPPMSQERAVFIAREVRRYFRQLLEESPDAQTAEAAILEAHESARTAARENERLRIFRTIAGREPVVMNMGFGPRLREEE